MISHNRTLNEQYTDPWIVLLAIITLLAIMFFLSVRSVSASLPMTESAVPIAKPSIASTSVNDKIAKSGQQIWFGDITDISNERAGNAHADANNRKQNGSAHIQQSETGMGGFLDLFKSLRSSGSIDSKGESIPSFLTP